MRAADSANSKPSRSCSCTLEAALIPLTTKRLGARLGRNSEIHCALLARTCKPAERITILDLVRFSAESAMLFGLVLRSFRDYLRSTPDCEAIKPPLRSCAG